MYPVSPPKGLQLNKQDSSNLKVRGEVTFRDQREVASEKRVAHVSMMTSNAVLMEPGRKRASWLKRSTAAGAVALLLTAALASPAMATQTPALPAAFVDELTSVWTDHGVDASVQAELLEKLQGGTPLDSMTADHPISSDSSTSDGFATTVNTYGDGSINVVSVELPKETAADPNARVIIGCSGGGTSNTYTNCSVSGWFTGVQLSFFAGYTLSSAGNARINSYTTATLQACAVGLSCTPASFELIRTQQSGSAAAQVNVVTNWSFLEIGGGGTTRLALYVKNLSATTN
jgi:hypothetical protein